MPSEAAVLDIDSCLEHNASYTVTVVGGFDYDVPKDTRNRHYKDVLQWEADGGVPTSSETSKKRRLRNALKENIALRAIVAQMAEDRNITPLAMRNALVSQIT